MRKPIQHLPPNVLMCGKLILQIVEDIFALPSSSMRARGRYHNLVATRCMCYFLMRTINDFGVTDIAGFFERDHASVIHGLNTHQNLYMHNHKDYRDKFKKLEVQYKIRLADADGIEDSAMKQVIEIDKTIKRLKKVKSYLMRTCLTEANDLYDNSIIDAERNQE